MDAVEVELEDCGILKYFVAVAQGAVKDSAAAPILDPAYGEIVIPALDEPFFHVSFCGIKT